MSRRNTRRRRQRRSTWAGGRTAGITRAKLTRLRFDGDVTTCHPLSRGTTTLISVHTQTLKTRQPQQLHHLNVCSSPFAVQASVFLGCILYADDIILLSGSCIGLQQMVDICANYGRQWDIKFNATKSQCITFGGNRACSFRISLNNAELTSVAKLKYFGCFSMSGRAKLILAIVHVSFMVIL